jgi:hypothetical protein
MRRLGTFTATAVLGLVLFAVTPATVYACISDHPTFTEAVRGARAIARVTIVEGFDPWFEDASRSETYRVERVLKGSLPALVTVAPAVTSLCNDSVSYFGGDEGRTIIVAFDLSYYDHVIHPMWAEDVDGVEGVFGSAGMPPGVSTLAGLEAAILDALGTPNTSMELAERPQDSSALVLILAVGLAALAASLRRFGESAPIHLGERRRC